jgi:hypothetical protein
MSLKLNKISEIQFLTNKLPKATYKFAKSMANIPHAYTLRTTWSNQQDFFTCVELIRKYGYEQKFFNKTYIYYNVGDYQYWTMGSPLEKTILINRALLDERHKNKD